LTVNREIRFRRVAGECALQSYARAFASETHSLKRHFARRCPQNDVALISNLVSLPGRDRAADFKLCERCYRLNSIGVKQRTLKLDRAGRGSGDVRQLRRDQTEIRADVGVGELDAGADRIMLAVAQVDGRFQRALLLQEFA